MKSSPSPPPPPDPQAVAAAQTQSNDTTAAFQQRMNLINQNTPLGSLTYTQDNAGDPYSGVPPQYTANVALSPTGQQEFDLQQQTGEALDNLALAGTGQVSQAMNTPQSYAGLPQTSTINPNNLPSLYGIDTSTFSSVPGINADALGSTGQLDLSKLGNTGKIDLSKLGPTGSIDPSKLGPLGSFDPSSFGPAPTANEEDYQNAQKALYGQYTANLDPQWGQQEKQLKDRLTQQGITEGSDAWNNEVSNFQRQKSDAYLQAQRDAVTGASSLEAQQFGMSNAAYQNLVANALNKANVQNTDYSLGLGTQEEEANLANTGFGLNLNAQNAAAALENAGFGLNLGAKEAGAQLENTGYGLKLGTQEAQNQAALTKNAQDLAAQQARAATGQTNYSLGLGTQEAEDAANQAARQQGITEANYLRELPINEVSALLHGGEVAQPTFQNTPQTQVANTNVAGITQASFQDAQQNYQTQMQQQNAMIGAIFGAAGTALGGWATGGFA